MHLLFFIVLQPVAVIPPRILRSSMLLRHKSPPRPTDLCCALHSSTVMSEWLFLSLSTPRPVPTLLINKGGYVFQTKETSLYFLQDIVLSCFFTCAIHACMCDRSFLLCQTRSSLSQLRKHHNVTMWKKKEVAVLFHYQNGSNRHTSPQTTSESEVQHLNQKVRGCKWKSLHSNPPSAIPPRHHKQAMFVISLLAVN